MKRKVRKFVEGGYGDVSSEDYGMGSQQEMIERNIEENERRRMMEGQTSPIRSPEITKGTTVEELQEPGTAGFSRAPIKQPAGQAKPATKPATKPTTSKPVAAKPETKPTEKPMGRTAMGKTAEMEMEAVKKAPAKKPADGKSLSSYAPDARSGRSTNVSYLRKDRLGMEPDMYIARRRMKEGFKSGGSVGSASKRADGIATKGKTRGRYI